MALAVSSFAIGVRHEGLRWIVWGWLALGLIHIAFGGFVYARRRGAVAETLIADGGPGTRATSAEPPFRTNSGE
jgi:hypothetical protein